MKLSALKEVFEKSKREGKNCYATNSAHYGEFIIGELSIIQSVKENEVILFRTFNNTVVSIHHSDLLKFNYHY